MVFRWNCPGSRSTVSDNHHPFRPLLVVFFVETAHRSGQPLCLLQRFCFKHGEKICSRNSSDAEEKLSPILLLFILFGLQINTPSATSKGPQVKTTEPMVSTKVTNYTIRSGLIFGPDSLTKNYIFPTKTENKHNGKFQID